MRRIDELALVVELACETRDRTPDEQRALIETALRVDTDRGSFVITNSRPVRPHLLTLAVDTYDPSEGRRVEPTKPQRERWERLRDKWRSCGDCGQPLGAHPADRCP